MNSVDITNAMIKEYNIEKAKNRETSAQDGYRRATDWLNEYRYENELDNSTITITLNLFEQWLAQFPEWQ